MAHRLTSTTPELNGLRVVRSRSDGYAGYTDLHGDYTPTSTADAPARSWAYSVPWKWDEDLRPGDLNCRSHGRIYEDVTGNTCVELAEQYWMRSADKFHRLNHRGGQQLQEHQALDPVPNPGV